MTTSKTSCPRWKIINKSTSFTRTPTSTTRTVWKHLNPTSKIEEHNGDMGYYPGVAAATLMEKQHISIKAANKEQTIDVLHTGTECTEHIQIIINSAQKVDNVILTLYRSLSTIWFGVIKTTRNTEIFPSSCILRGVWA